VLDATFLSSQELEVEYQRKSDQIDAEKQQKLNELETQLTRIEGWYNQIIT